jgi:hypothetical protein
MKGDNNMITEIKNAKIVYTTLGYEDHGIFTATIGLDYGSGGQAFGGRCLRDKYAYEFISGVLNALEVKAWEKLIGVSCRVEADNNSVHRIGHYLKDQWFDPREWEKISLQNK